MKKVHDRCGMYDETKSCAERHVPGKPIEDTPCRCSLKETHWRAEDGKCHPLMQFAAGLCFALALRSATMDRIRRERTSIEQKIQRMSVCTTTRAADPTPNAK
jgi:hypothetical protein